MIRPDKAAFRDAMSRLGAAVNIVTTDGPAGRAGFTASAVCSVTDSPPTLLICLNRSASVWPVFTAHRHLCVNTLAAGQQDLALRFGGKTPMEERFAAARWSDGVDGCPRLEGALLSCDCQVSQVVNVGTHDILFCTINAITRNDDSHGLVWFDRTWHPLPGIGQPLPGIPG